MALPGVEPGVVRDITTMLAPFKLPIKTLPRLDDILDGKISINQIRPLAIEDLLQRPPIGLSPEPVQRLIEGKRIFVTGAGGSIGSELCRQIMGFNPQSLILYERHENSLYTIGSEIADNGQSSCVHSILGDIIDEHRLDATIKLYRPEIIFHAAAHKHVPLMEVNPGEAVKNNVLGTQMVAEAAVKYDVEHFVLISTDKAVNPSSVMGATKRGAELVIQAMAQRSSTCFLTVRFGNVLGSNGSVVPRFQGQIKAGGPVTVTHPDVRRYFMSIPEAVGLVLQAATLGEQGTIYLLEMGEQIKLVDLARNLIRLSGRIPEKEVAIEFVGLRPGEKLEEELVGIGEQAMPSALDKILKIRTNGSFDCSFLLKIQEMVEAGNLNNHQMIINQLQQLIPTFIPAEVLEQTEGEALTGEEKRILQV
jgi:FlaA1/EpsC-like NDP-sugar epimerase